MSWANSIQWQHQFCDRAKSHSPVATLRCDRDVRRSKSEGHFTVNMAPVQPLKSDALLMVQHPHKPKAFSVQALGDVMATQVEIIDLEVWEPMQPVGPTQQAALLEQASSVETGPPTQATAEIVQAAPRRAISLSPPASTRLRRASKTRIVDSPPPEVICVRQVQRSQSEIVQQSESTNQIPPRSSPIAPRERPAEATQGLSQTTERYAQQARKRAGSPIKETTAKRRALAASSSDQLVQASGPNLLSYQSPALAQRSPLAKPSDPPSVDNRVPSGEVEQDITRCHTTPLLALPASSPLDLESLNMDISSSDQKFSSPIASPSAIATSELAILTKTVAPVANMSTQDTVSTQDTPSHWVARNWGTRQYLDLAEMALQRFPFDQYCQKYKKDIGEVKEVFQATIMMPLLAKGERDAGYHRGCYGEQMMREWKESQKEMIKASREEDVQNKAYEAAEEERLKEVGWKDFDTCNKCKMRPVTKPFCMMCGKKTMYRPTTIPEAREYVKFCIRQYDNAMEIYEAKVEKEKKSVRSKSRGIGS